MSWRVCASVIFTLCLFSMSGAAGQEPISGLINSSILLSTKVSPETPIPVEIRLENRSNHPIIMDKIMFSLGYDRTNGLDPEAKREIRPGDTFTLEAALHASSSGTHVIRLYLHQVGKSDVVGYTLGQVEVVEGKTLWERYSYYLPVLALFIGAVGSWLLARFNGTVMRRQKQIEAVTSIIENQGREYYFAIVNAAREMWRAVSQYEAAPDGWMKTVMYHRACFFAGLLLYKDNEFAFSKGLLYLKHLWAEELVSKLIRNVKQVIVVDPASEMTIHKCFSDIVAYERKGEPNVGAVYRFRNLYDYYMLIESGGLKDEVINLKMAFQHFRSNLESQENIDILHLDIRSLRAIVTYEYTDLYEAWYACRIADWVCHPVDTLKAMTTHRWTSRSRKLPKKRPPFFSEPSEDRAGWSEVKTCAGRLNRRNRQAPPAEAVGLSID
jgi:hypothetical protein